MAHGLSPKLPLLRDPQDGYALNKSYSEMITQNLKMLILTIQGERIMDPEFGVGLRKYLFRNNTPSVHSEIKSQIRSQIGKYMPFIEVVEINISDISEGYSEVNGSNAISVKMEFIITPLESYGTLEINESVN